MYICSRYSLTVSLGLLFVRELVSQGARSAFDQTLTSTERQSPHGFCTVQGGLGRFSNVRKSLPARLPLPVCRNFFSLGPHTEGPSISTKIDLVTQKPPSQKEYRLLLCLCSSIFLLLRYTYLIGWPASLSAHIAPFLLALGDSLSSSVSFSFRFSFPFPFLVPCFLCLPRPQECWRLYASFVALIATTARRIVLKSIYLSLLKTFDSCQLERPPSS